MRYQGYSSATFTHQCSSFSNLQFPLESFFYDLFRKLTRNKIIQFERINKAAEMSALFILIVVF